MSIDIKTTPVKTWQFYNACKVLLGMTSLTKLLKFHQGRLTAGLVILILLNPASVIPWTDMKPC
ncbi:MAG: hypothetical protein KAR45_21790 [Desulfobacteraceae bacterium]|nr:hypothetical protein [Desulfobacteraceae bacterium]